MRESIKEAKNVDEAIELACAELGVERDVTEFEIINLPKRGFLGLKNTPAKVRVYIEEPAVSAPARQTANQPKTAARSDSSRRTEAAARPAASNQTQAARPAASNQPQTARPAASNQPQAARPETSRRPEERREPRPAAPAPARANMQGDAAVQPPRENYPSTPLPPLEFMSMEQTEGKARVAADYLKELLGDMGVDAGITVAYSQSGGAVLRLSGDGLGVIIGRRGETLDSLQYLVGLVGNRGDGDYMRITIDSGNYREKRERTLVSLAQKLAASAIKYGRASTLEPMNPYERRIIHATVSEIEGVTSSSIGDDPNRRVVITPTGARPPQQLSDRDGARRGGRPNNNRGPRPAGGRPPFRGGDRPERPAGFTPRDAAAPAINPGASTPTARTDASTPTVRTDASTPSTRTDASTPTARTDEPRREFRPRPDAPRPEFRSRPDGRGPDGRGDFGSGGRPPRRDFREGNRAPSQPVTPTSLDREYAKEVEQGRPISSPEAPAQPAVKENAAPAQPLREGKDLPLYGKIDI